MNFTSQQGPVVVMKEIPFLLLFVAAFFSLPFLAFSLVQIVKGTDADGKWFCFFFGLFIGWLLLEFVATRERIEVDLQRRTMSRTVRGVFRKQTQQIDLKEMTYLELEIKRGSRGQRFQYLYLRGEHNHYLVNTPSKRYMDHRKTGRALSKLLGLPFHIETFFDTAL
jgi:hypothetical protein